LSIWEGDREGVKRSDRDEPIRVVVHVFMEAMLRISLYSHLYLKLAKTLFLTIVYVFSPTKLEKRAEQVLPGFQRDGGKGREDREERLPKQCVHI
jgi:hypothetical protein